MKRLYRLVLVSFAGPFVMTFFIALFILLMQFLWKYIDDLVGKGLEWYVVVELFVYASATFVPLALPLALLMSSLMTFGNLAEQYELVACKASGISLQKTMRPLILAAVVISIGAFYFSNRVLPYANLKMNALLYDVRLQKPAFQLKEGIFYNGIDGYSMRVAKKENDGQTLRKIMIYDHTLGMGNTKVVVADSGKMTFSDDKLNLFITLYHGYSYEEKENKVDRIDTHPLLRSDFEEQSFSFDLSGFRMMRTDEELFRDNYQMLNLVQLQQAVDTMHVHREKRLKEFSQNLVPYFTFKRDSSLFEKTAGFTVLKDPVFIRNFPSGERKAVIDAAMNLARSTQAYTDFSAEDLDARGRIIARHEIEWHRKFTLSIACLVLFFIGAPLGAIIRKGGLGMPVVVSALFFITFHVISITGEKFAKEGVITPVGGMWLATAVLFPVGVFLTYKATTDSVLFDAEAYQRFFRKWTRKTVRR